MLVVSYLMAGWSSSKVTHSHGCGRQVGAGCCQGASVTFHMNVPTDCLNILTTWELASSRMVERQQGRSYNAFCALISAVMGPHFHYFFFLGVTMSENSKRGSLGFTIWKEMWQLADIFQNCHIRWIQTASCMNSQFFCPLSCSYYKKVE